MIVSMNMHV